MSDQTLQSLEVEWELQVSAVPAFSELVASMEMEKSSSVFALSSLRLVWVIPKSQTNYEIRTLLYRNRAQGFDSVETTTNDIINEFKSNASMALEYVARNLTTLSGQLGPFNAQN
jgi:hypothetical protein